MASFNDSLAEYKKQLDKGEIQVAYRGLMDYMMHLKTHFRNRYPGFSVPGNLYQGYMDMTYFALYPEDLKKKKLKIAIVLIHDKMKFEIWLSGINKQIQTKYWNLLKLKDLGAYRLPGNLKGSDSILEYVLAENPDFSDPDALTRQIESETIKFIKDVEGLIKDN